MDTNINLSKIILKTIYAVNVINLTSKQTYVRKNRTNYAFSLKLKGETIYVSKSKKYYSKNIIDFSIQDFKLSKKSQQEISKLFTYISNVWKNKKPNYMLKCKSIFYEILSEIKLEGDQSYTYNNLKKIIEPSIDYMNTHYEDINISLESLAQLSNISTIYYRKVFNKIYNTSPIKYLIKIRINKAKELLRADFISISDIAALTGFSSVYTFSKTFKKETGVSPTEYKKIKSIK